MGQPTTAPSIVPHLKHHQRLALISDAIAGKNAAINLARMMTRDRPSDDMLSEALIMYDVASKVLSELGIKERSRG